MSLLVFIVADAASLATTVLSPKEASKLARLSGPSHQLFRSAFRLRSAAAAIYTRHGLAGFYTGILPNVMQVRPASFHLARLMVSAVKQYFPVDAFFVISLVASCSIPDHRLRTSNDVTMPGVFTI